jgi:hypothetical protein
VISDQWSVFNQPEPVAAIACQLVEMSHAIAISGFLKKAWEFSLFHKFRRLTTDN